MGRYARRPIRSGTALAQSRFPEPTESPLSLTLSTRRSRASTKRISPCPVTATVKSRRDRLIGNVPDRHGSAERFYNSPSRQRRGRRTCYTQKP